MKLSLFYFYILVIAALADPTKYRYKLDVISFIEEATHLETLTHLGRYQPEKYICELPEPERLEMCKEAWKLDYFRSRGYGHLKNGTVGPDKVYRILYYEETHCCDDRKELMSPGFQCPSRPPYYLRPGPNNETVYVTVATEPHKKYKNGAMKIVSQIMFVGLRKQFQAKRNVLQTPQTLGSVCRWYGARLKNR